MTVVDITPHEQRPDTDHLAQMSEQCNHANQQLERLRILTLLLAQGRARDVLSECQQDELDHWMFDVVHQAQTHNEAAMAHAAQRKCGSVSGGHDHA